MDVKIKNIGAKHARFVLPLLSLAVVWGVVLATTPCQASLVHQWGQAVPEAEWSGSNASLAWSSEITAGGNWGNAGTTISWNISFDEPSNLFTYQYTWTSLPPALSHIIIEVTDGATVGQFRNFVNTAGPEDPDEGPEVKTYGADVSNPGFPDGVSLYGIKLQGFSSFDPLTFSFQTSRQPVWGDFYAKGGNDSYAYNVGFGLTGIDSYYIARPDGMVPIPSTVWLLGCGLIGLVGLRRRLRV